MPAIPRLAGQWIGERVQIYKFSEKASNTVFVVKGRPNGFVGLDEGIFHSANNFDKNVVNTPWSALKYAKTAPRDSIGVLTARQQSP